jgi:hypothetical protein
LEAAFSSCWEEAANLHRIHYRRFGPLETLSPLRVVVKEGNSADGMGSFPVISDCRDGCTSGS